MSFAGPDPYNPAMQMTFSLPHMPPEEAKEVIEQFLRDAQRPRPADDFRVVPILAAVGILIGLIIWGFLSLAGWFGNVVLSHQWQTAIYVFFSLTLCLIALAFYRLKCRHKLAYAMCEVAFGVASIVYASWGLLEFLIRHASGASDWLTPQTTFALLAGLYVIVRGLTNMEDALRIRRKEAASTRGERLWLRLFYEPLIINFKRVAGG